MKNIDTLFSELAQYTRLQDETAAIIEGLKDEIKRYMEIFYTGKKQMNTGVYFPSGQEQLNIIRINQEL